MTQQQLTQAFGMEQYFEAAKLNGDALLSEQRKADFSNAKPGKLSDYDCADCKNKGYIVTIGDNGFMRARPCKCNPVRKTIQRAKKSGASALIQKHKFGNFSATEDWQASAKQMAENYCKQDKPGWLYMGGQTGAGKTHLCTAAFGNLIKRGYAGSYMLWRDTMRKLTGAGFAGFSNTEAEISKYKSSPLLYIDDLFKTDDGQKPQRQENEIAFEIINSRYNQELPTIISSEMPLSVIAGFNGALAGRIAERCGEYTVKIDAGEGKNYRLKK